MKKCQDCSETKPLSEFNRKGKKYQGKCRKCQKLWYKNYYNSVDKERNRLLKKNYADREAIRLMTREKRDVPCMDCGERYPYYVMDFDHRDPTLKEYTVASMVNCGNIDRVRKEIEKCDVVCSNCHRIRTHSGIV